MAAARRRWLASPRAITANLLIQVNRFCSNALEVVYERFRLSAALMHKGSEVTSGHYRTVLQDNGQQLITDDALPVRKLCKQTDGPHCRANYYAFVDVHCPSP